MTSVNVFIEKAKAIVSSIKESFDQSELMELAQTDEPTNVIGYNADIDNEDEIVSSDKEVQVSTNDAIQPELVSVEKPPRFRIYWRAWKEGNNSSGQTESNLETAQMARAEAMTKLYDLGFNDIEILAIETIQNQ